MVVRSAEKWFLAGSIIFIAACLIPVSPVLAKGFPDRLALVQLLRDGELGQLEKLIRGYQGAYETGEIEEIQLEAAYFAFANSSPELEEKLDRWVAKTPASYPALMARGVYLWNLGLLMRGPRTDRDLTPEHLREFRTYFAGASADLIEAIDEHHRLGIAYSLLIHMATDLGEDTDLIEFARRGALADPRSLVVHRRYLESQRPWLKRPQTDVQTSLAQIERYVSDLEPRFATNSELAVLRAYPTLVKADLLVREGDREASIALYDEAAASGYWVYLYRRGVNHFRLQSFELALMDFERALEARPQAAEVLNMRARTLRALGDGAGADSAWSRALALNPRDPKILFHQAAALRDDKDFEAAAHALTVATDLGRFSAYIWDARGRIYLYDLQQFDKASADLERTIDFAPSSQRYWFNYAAALYKQRDCEAITALGYYLGLCETQACPAESMEWTKAWSEALHASYKCRPRAPLVETRSKEDSIR